MAHQEEPRKARITMFVVEKRVDRNDVCKSSKSQFNGLTYFRSSSIESDNSAV